MKLARKILVVLLALFLVGFAKRPLEDSLAQDLRERRLLPKPLDFETRQALGQTSYAIALGGMRSLIASTKNLKAHTHFEHQEWAKLENEFQTIRMENLVTVYANEVAPLDAVLGALATAEGAVDSLSGVELANHLFDDEKCSYRRDLRHFDRPQHAEPIANLKQRLADLQTYLGDRP